MKRNQENSESKFTQLRQEAITRQQSGQHAVAKRFTIDPRKLALADAQRLIEELQIYHVELEIQNEELREAQQQLESARDRFSHLFHSSPVGYVTINQSGLVSEVNRTLSTMVQVRRARILQRPFSFLIERADSDIYANFLHELFEQRVEKSQDLRLKTQAGKSIFVELTGRVQVDNDVVYCQLIVKNIETRKKLEQTQRLLKLALEASSDGVAICDMRERGFPFIYASPSAEALVDWEPDRLIGQEWAKLYDNSAEKITTLRNAITTGQSADLILRFNHSQHGERHYEVTVYPLDDEYMRTAYFVHVLRDITDRVKTEETIRRAQHIDSVGALSNGVAKQFNTLISNVIAQISVAEMKGDGEQNALGHALEAAQKAQSLARQMAAYAGHESGAIGQIELNSLVNDTIALAAVSLPTRHTITLKITDQPLLIESSRGQVQQIILNLVLNASESIPLAGEIIVKTTALDWLTDSAELNPTWIIENSLPSRVACLQISDNGSGIQHHSLPDIFDPFYSTKDSGRGLGLAATLGAVRANGGALGLTSSPAGTVVTVLIPLVKDVVK